ncbi:MAG: hypothetical protein L3J67_10625 [Hyphomicrobiaceae bacterium]|nr:hypothetical protein [Hyphomicrobiaceae bacterium]
MTDKLKREFDVSMFEIYQRAKNEVKYTAHRFYQLLDDHGGIGTAKMLISSDNVSDGYVALWEKERLDLTVEAMILAKDEFHPLFTPEELEICRKRLKEYGFRE